MATMNIKIIYHSSTGNTEKLAGIEQTIDLLKRIIKNVSDKNVCINDEPESSELL